MREPYFLRQIFQMKKTDNAAPRSTAMMDASGPNSPPVRMDGPLVTASKMLSSLSCPDTAKPSTLPWVKFQAQWMPIGNQSDPAYLYAAPSSSPAFFESVHSFSRR